MSVLGPLGGWRPLRDVERIVSLGIGTGLGIGVGVGRALIPNVPLTPAQMLQLALQTVGEQFLHKRITFRAGPSRVTMTPVELDCEIDSFGLAMGQFAAIRMVAEDVRWGEVELQRLTLVFRDTRIRNVYAPMVVFGSVEVHLAVSAREIRRIVAEHQPELTVDIGRDRVIRAHWSRMQRLGHLAITPRVDGSVVYLHPSTARLGGAKLDVARRLRPWEINVPDLPYGLRLTAVEAGDRQLLVYGISEDASERLSSIPIAEIIPVVRAAVRVL